MAEPVDPIKVLEECGLEETLVPIELEDGEEVTFDVEGGHFFAKGPGVLFVGLLPKEAFDD